MCVLIKHGKNNSFSDALILDFYNKNRDGLGVMWAEGGQIYVKKIIPKNDQEVIDFYRNYADIKDCVIHFRKMTVGEVSLENCHPFMVNKNIWMAHNGTFDLSQNGTDGKSDSFVLAKRFFRKITESDNSSFLFDSDWLSLFGDIIGKDNKLIFLDNKGNISIVNEYSGVYLNDGSWISNKSEWSFDLFFNKSCRESPRPQDQR